MTQWQHCSPECNGQKHKQDWSTSALMLQETVFYLPLHTDPASVFAPQLPAAHMSLFFPLLSKPPFALEAAEVEQSCLHVCEEWGEEQRRELVFVSLRICFSAEKGGERGFALGFTFCCSFHFCQVRAPGVPLAVKSHQLVSGKLVAGGKETSPTPQFPKGHWPLF